MEEFQRPTNIVLFVIIITLCIILLYGVYSYTKPYLKTNAPEINQEKVLNESRYKMALSFVNEEYKPIGVHYTLKQGNSVQQDGNVEAGVTEYFNNATINVTYSLYADNDKYYMGKADCINQNCSVMLFKNGQVKLTGVELKENLFKIIISVDDGIMKNPLLCVRYKNLYNISISNVNVISNPIRIQTAYDSCYFYGMDFKTETYFFDLNYNKKAGNSTINVILIDQGYDGEFNPSYEIDNEIPDINFEYNLSNS